jgi:hypothetical protein
VDLFGQRSFAVLFVLLLGVPALPLPTGGATHVFELIAMLLALQLIVGRDQIWLPRRWCALSLAGSKQQRFIAALMRMVRRLERLSRRRLGPGRTGATVEEAAASHSVYVSQPAAVAELIEKAASAT